MNPMQPQSIFLQVIERIHNGILSGTYKVGTRIPSVRDMAARLEVNPNTIVKAYDRLIAAGLIESRPGVGNYIREGAIEIVTQERQKRFYNEILPAVAKEMKLLNIPPLRARSGASPPRPRPNYDYQRGITHSGPYSQKKRGRMHDEHPTSFCISISPLVQRDRAKSCPSLETRRDFYRLVFFSAFDSIFEVLDPKLVNCRVIAKTFEVALYSPTLSCNLIAPALFL